MTSAMEDVQMRKIWFAGFLVSSLVWAGMASAVISESYKCNEGKVKAHSKFEVCVDKLVAKFYLTGSINGGVMKKCREKYAAAWTKLQAKLPNAPACQLPRLTDLGDTVKDNLTGLVWEKKTTVPLSGANPADPHDVDNVYTYSINGTGPFPPNGTVFTDFLASLNGAGFGGSFSWRVPTLAEMLTLPLVEENCPADCHLDPIYGPFTLANSYWTSKESLLVPELPGVDVTVPYMNWVVINAGIFYHDGKAANLSVRAVHGGV